MSINGTNNQSLKNLSAEERQKVLDLLLKIRPHYEEIDLAVQTGIGNPGEIIDRLLKAYDQDPPVKQALITKKKSLIESGHITAKTEQAPKKKVQPLVPPNQKKAVHKALEQKLPTNKELGKVARIPRKIPVGTEGTPRETIDFGKDVPSITAGKSIGEILSKPLPTFEALQALKTNQDNGNSIHNPAITRSLAVTTPAEQIQAANTTEEKENNIRKILTTPLTFLEEDTSPAIQAQTVQEPEVEEETIKLTINLEKNQTASTVEQVDEFTPITINDDTTEYEELVNKDTVANNLEKYSDIWDRSTINAFNGIEEIREKYRGLILNTELDQKYHQLIKKIEEKDILVLTDKYIDFKTQIKKKEKEAKDLKKIENKTDIQEKELKTRIEEAELIQEELRKLIEASDQSNANISQIFDFQREFKEIKKQNETFNEKLQDFNRFLEHTLNKSGSSAQRYVDEYSNFLKENIGNLSEKQIQQLSTNIEHFTRLAKVDKAKHYNRLGRFELALEELPKETIYDELRAELESLDKESYETVREKLEKVKYLNPTQMKEAIKKEDDGEEKLTKHTQLDGKAFSELYKEIKLTKNNHQIENSKLIKAYRLASYYDYPEKDELNSIIANKIKFLYQNSLRTNNWRDIANTLEGLFILTNVIGEDLNNTKNLNKATIQQTIDDNLNKLLKEDFSKEEDLNQLSNNAKHISQILTISSLKVWKEFFSHKIGGIKSKLQELIKPLNNSIEKSNIEDLEKRNKYLATLIKLIESTGTKQNQEIYNKARLMHLAGTLERLIKLDPEQQIERAQLMLDSRKTPITLDMEEAAKKPLQIDVDELEETTRFLNSIQNEAPTLRLMRELIEEGKLEEARKLMPPSIKEKTNK